MVVKEKDIKRNILAALKLWGVDVWPVFTGGIPCRAGAHGIIMRPNPAAGMPDIVGVLPNGLFLGIEVKTATGRQSDAQKAFQSAVEDNGGVYILARSVDDVRTQLTGVIYES